MSKIFWLALLTLTLILSACGDPDKPTISFYLAAQRGDIDQVERHLFWGSDPNRLGPDGRAPLHTAAHLGRFILAELLLDNGADIDLPDHQGATPLELAVLAGRIRLARILIKRGAKLEPDAWLLEAARQSLSDRDVIAFLAEQGANLEVRDTAGDTPLLTAIRAGNHRLARHLIAQGADVNARASDGASTLAIALNLGQDQLAELLERNGAVIGRGAN